MNQAAARDMQGRRMCLDYYLEEEFPDHAEGNIFYGIRVEMRRQGTDGILAESGSVSSISDSREQVTYMLERFCRMQVTPTGLPEAAEDERIRYDRQVQECF